METNENLLKIPGGLNICVKIVIKSVFYVSWTNSKQMFGK